MGLSECFCGYNIVILSNYFILQLLSKFLDSQFVLNCKIYMGGNRMPSLQEGGRVRLFVVFV